MTLFEIDEAVKHEEFCFGCGGTEDLVTFEWMDHYETWCANCMSKDEREGGD